MKTVNKQTNHRRGRGSALIWILVWLLGVVGIAWTGLNYAVPKFERKLQVAVEESITAFNSDSLNVSAVGRDVTLTGEVDSEEDKSQLLAAANSTLGVGSVRSQLIVVPTANTDTPEPVEEVAEPAIQVATAEILPMTANPSVTVIETKVEESAPSPEESQPLVGNEPAAPAPVETLVAASNEQLAPNDSTLLALNDSVSASNIAKQKPNISIRVFGNILSIEGTVATSDDTTDLVQNALTSFNRDIVSNGLRHKDDVENASWLTALMQIMPLMESMSDAQIGITDQQMTLSGIAPSRTVHDSVINEALTSMGNLSLVEKIKIASDSSDSNDAPLVLTAKAEQSDIEVAAKARQAARLEAVAAAEAADEAKNAADAAAKTNAEEQAKLAAEAAAKAKAEEQARLAAEAAAKAKADEQARFAAEAAAKAKADEQARLAAEAAAKAKAEEQARLAAEAAAKAKADEQARLAAEAAAKAKADEQARLAAEASAKAKADEDARLAAEAAAKAKADEQARLAAEAAAKAKADEDARLAAKAAAKAKADEQARLAAEAAAKAKADEQARLAAEAAAKAKADEEARLAAEAAAKAKADEEARLAAEAAAKAKADEEARLAAEAAAKAKADEEARLAAETAAKAKADEQARRAAEAAKSAKQRDDIQAALSKLPSLRILFGSEGNSLTAASYDVLDQVSEVLVQYPETTVIVEGYTDATGDPQRNMDLSLRRATTVRDYLIQRGVSVYNLRAIGLGEANPIVSNETPEGRAVNRRIEFTFQ